jgi:hypothetical protein
VFAGRLKFAEQPQWNWRFGLPAVSPAAFRRGG